MAIGLSKDRLGTIIENELTIGMSPEERRTTRKLAGARGMSQNAWVVEALTAAAFEGRVRGGEPPIGGPAS